MCEANCLNHLGRPFCCWAVTAECLWAKQMSIMHGAYPYFFAQDCVTQCITCIGSMCAHLRIYVCIIRACACCSSYAWQLYAFLLLCCLCVPVCSMQWHRMSFHDCMPARSTSRYHFCMCVRPTYGSHMHATQAGIACVCEFA